MASRTNDSCYPETMAARGSIISANDVTDDQISTLSCFLTTDKNIATRSLTGPCHVARVYSKSPHYLPLACLALCLNPPLGIPACICAILSRRHHFAGDERKSAQYSHWAFWLSLIAIAVSIVVIFFIIVYFHVIKYNIIREIKNLNSPLNPQGEMENSTMATFVTS